MRRERWIALFFALGSSPSWSARFPATRSSLAPAPTRSHSLSAPFCSPPAGRCRRSSRSANATPAAPDRRLAGRGNPIRRHAVLQRHDLSGSANIHHQLQLRQARVAPRRVRLDLLPRLGRDRLHASARHGWLPARDAQAGGNHRSTCSVASSRDLRHRRLCRPFDPLGDQLSGGQLNTVLGAACFLTCALATLLTGSTLKSPQLPRLHRLEADVKRDVDRIV